MIHTAIIEDDRFLLEALARAVAIEGDFKLALQTTTAEEALEFDGWHQVDVAIIDLNLPGLSGSHLISVLAARFPHLPLLACSVSEDKESVLAALKLGASGYLLKRDLESEGGICAAVRQALKGGAPITATPARWMLDDIRAHSVMSASEPLTA